MKHEVVIYRGGKALSHEIEIASPQSYSEGTIKCGVVMVSTSFLTNYLGVSRKTLAEWDKKGCPKLEYGKWDLIAVLRWKGILELPPIFE